MYAFALSVCAAILLTLPGFCQSVSWEATGSQGDNQIGNELVFANGDHGFTATSWGYTGKKNNQSFSEGMGVVYSTGIGVTNGNERAYQVPEHQIDNARGNDWILFVFDGPVSDVNIVVNPYGTWDRDVTYYTANVSGDVNLAGLTYSDLDELGFSERVDDLSTRSNQERTLNVTGDGSFNAILIGAVQGKPGGKRDVDRFKIGAVDATYSVVPEPSAALLGLLGGLVLLRRRR
ncbi:hypothetical protein [Haloferula sp. BvORR071]|uniref:hypothetical protein n=1 Tax=Haloferula sp. BvORR071 TaxID=1396141 RepID=UPI0005593313|nr:hypothetical protein [Haloferula sp. BvORR071]